MKKTLLVTFALCLSVLQGGAWADTDAPPPAYRDALSNLKAADSLLQAPDAGAVVVDQHACDLEVRHAIRELALAANESSTYKAVPPSNPGRRAQRLREVRRLLAGALDDVQRASARAGQGLRSLTVSRLTHAIRYVDQAMTDSATAP